MRTVMATLGMSVTLAVLGASAIHAAPSPGGISLDRATARGLTVALAALMPGDIVTRDLVVRNDGATALRYGITSSTTNPDARGLRDTLIVTIRTLDTVERGGPCDDFDGAKLYEGVLGASAAAFGDSATGWQAGDRTLGPLVADISACGSRCRR